MTYLSDMPKLYQLWRSAPDEALLMDLLACFNLKGLDDRAVFCKHSLARYGTAARVHALQDRLMKHYIPCKGHIYLGADPPTELRCVTILRQVLRLYEHKLMTRERVCNSQKCITYRLWPRDLTEGRYGCRDCQKVVSFD